MSSGREARKMHSLSAEFIIFGPVLGLVCFVMLPGFIARHVLENRGRRH